MKKRKKGKKKRTKAVAGSLLHESPRNEMRKERRETTKEGG